MTSNIEQLKSGDFNQPMVIFPLKQYEELMDYIDDVEDRLSIAVREEEPVISKQEMDKLFSEKFGEK